MLNRLGARALRTRWLVRAPIGLYRRGWGFLFGRRILMLEHTGRSTGARRYVMLEVVEHPSAGRYVVVAGFGTAAQWYRNVLVEPRVRVSCGRMRNRTATARPMTPTEADDALERYASAHPRAWRRLRGVIEEAVGHPVEGLPMVALDLTPPVH